MDGWGINEYINIGLYQHMKKIHSSVHQTISQTIKFVKQVIKPALVTCIAL